MQQHVLIIVQNLPVPLDRRVWLECRALIDAGYRVSVICPKGDGDPDFEVIDGVRVHKYDPPPPASGIATFGYEFAYCLEQTRRRLQAVHRVEPIDAVQACNPPDTFFLLMRGLRRRGVRYVFDQHDLCPEVYAARFADPKEPVLRTLLWLERGTYRAADHVIATNESFKAVAMERGSLTSEDVTVVRSGPKAATMRRGAPDPTAKAGRRYLCAYLGIMGPQDGVDLALRSADILVNQRGRDDVQFAFMGFGDCYDDLRATATELGLDDYVTFTGRADDKVISRYLSTADLGISPDPKNAMNDRSTMNKTLEYMAFELPVVSFDLHETKVSAGPAALYVGDNDVAAYADAIEELLADPRRRATMGAAGRQRIEDSLSWETSARAYVGVYDRLFGESRSASSAAVATSAPTAG
ncbi:MAG: glycosyltransferase [Acidimicrobiia bacterium]|nr:glycosyltransferase [Acidimicrobiia bacterium]